MRWKIIAASVVFVLIGLSSLLYGGTIIYRNRQLIEEEGTTQLTGMVVDSEGNAVSGVLVESEDQIMTTGPDGRFLFDGIDVGTVDIDLYKEGYIPVEIRWLAYPLDEVKDDLEGSPNNISTERSIELLLERELIETELPENGTFKLIVDTNEGSGIIGNSYSYGLTETSMKMFNVTSGKSEFVLEGNGTFLISGEEETKIMAWRGLPGLEYNITPILMNLSGLPENLEVQTREIILEFSEQLDGGSFEIMILDPLKGTMKIDTGFPGTLISNVSIPVNDGLCHILFSGRDFRDREFRNIRVSEDSNRTINVEITEADPERILEGLDLPLNYSIGGIYIAMGLVMFTAAYLALGERKWNHLIVIALASFLIRGFYIGPVPINLVLSVMIVLILISTRDIFERRKRINENLVR
jgi:hypothetical protein